MPSSTTGPTLPGSTSKGGAGVRPTLFTVFAAALLVRFAALTFATQAPLGEGEILLDAGGNIAAGRGLSLSDTLLRVPPHAPPILRRTLNQWSEVGGVWGVVPPGRPTAFLPPLYPIMLSLFAPLPEGVLVSRILGVMIGSLTAALVYATARRWGGSGAIAAGAFAVLDPLAAFQSAEISTHNVAAFTAFLPVWLASRRGGAGIAAAAGFICGVAFLARPTAWLLVPLLGVVAWCRNSPRGAVLLVLGTVVALSPWVIRNAHDLGRPLVFTTNGGRNLWEFNNQKMGPEYEWSEPQPSRPLYDPVRRRHTGTLRHPELLPFPAFTTESEWERDRILTARFAGFAVANPRAYADLVGIRITQMLALWPLHAKGGLRLLFAAHSLPLLLLACVGAWGALRSDGLHRAVALFVMLFLALHVLTAAGFVYRGMIAPFLALLAGDGVSWLTCVRRARHTQGRVMP